MKKELSGVITALVTPFDEKELLDERAVREHVEYQIQCGIHGLCLLGGTGEPLSLSSNEVKLLVEVAADQVQGRIPLIVGALSASPGYILDIAEHAASCGASALMLIAPYFVRAPVRHILRHFQDIGKESPLPFVLFNSPSRSGVHLDVDFISRLLSSTEKFIAVKESTGDVVELERLRNVCGEQLTILQGMESLFLPSLAAGADGGILAAANLCPEHLLAVFTLWTAKQTITAQRKHLELMELIDILYSDGHPAPLKYALKLVGRPAGNTRRPLYAPEEQTRLRLRDELERIGLLQ
jgi:4-hydroxy-tetrahydrodipicolinate synthase